MRTFAFACCVAALFVSTAAAELITGTDEGGTALVKAFNNAGLETDAFGPYGINFTGGVRVAAGDFNGDSAIEIITGAGPGAAGGHVKVFDGVSGAELRSFFAYSPSIVGGVFVGSGDVNNDSIADIVTGADADAGAGPHVKVFDGATNAELRSFLAYGGGFGGGVRVAAGDIDNDNFDDVITGAGPAGAGHVKVFSGATGAELRSFLAYGGGYTGGVYVSGGDINNDGFDDVITGADSGVQSHVKVFDGVTSAEIRSFFAYGGSFTGGVRVASADINGDKFDDIITGAGDAGGGHVKVFSGATGAEIRSFFAFGARYNDGVFVAGANVIPEPAGGALVMLAGLALVTANKLGRRRLPVCAEPSDAT